MTDQHQLLPHLRTASLHRQQASLLAAVLKTEGRPLNQARAPLPAGGDPWALRGIPAIGYGIPGGAIPGTRPDQTIGT